MRLLIVFLVVVLTQCASQPKEPKIWTFSEVQSQKSNFGRSLGELKDTYASYVTKEMCLADSSSFAYVVGGINTMHRALEYPIEARKNRIEGDVLVRFIVDSNGEVSKLEVLSDSNRLLNDSVKNMIRNTAFIPAFCNAKPVHSIYETTFTFRVS